MGSKTPAARGELQWLRADRLTVDPAYQRPLSLNAVRVIVDNFDPDALGALIVSARADGSMVLLDGQQRHAALMQMGWGDQQVPCLVHTGLTVVQEAVVFTRLNVDRSRPHPVDIFTARVVAQEEDALAVQAVLDACGVRVIVGARPTSTQAIGAVETIHRIGGAPLLTWTLRASIEAWAGEQGSITAGVLQGLALFHLTYPTTARGALVAKMRRQTARELESRVRQLRALDGGNVASAMARVLVGVYNFRRPEDERLDPSKVPSRLARTGLGNIHGSGVHRRRAARKGKGEKR